MLEKYYKYKVLYKEYIIIMKYGNFYETIDNDALIMSSIFNYKINKLSNTFKVGFSINTLDNVINKLNDLNINYIVLDGIKKEFKNNNYNNYIFDKDIINYNLTVINEINNYLINNILNNISNKLERISEIIHE
ncbi:MAG: hypothetical protein ACI31V_06380 [Bacilli bacterium]